MRLKKSKGEEDQERVKYKRRARIKKRKKWS